MPPANPTTQRSTPVHPMAYQMEEPDYKLEVRQQPVYARVAIGKEKGMFFLNKPQH